MTSFSSSKLWHGIVEELTYTSRKFHRLHCQRSRHVSENWNSIDSRWHSDVNFIFNILIHVSVMTTNRTISQQSLFYQLTASVYFPAVFTHFIKSSHDYSGNTKWAIEFCSENCGKLGQIPRFHSVNFMVSRMSFGISSRIWIMKNEYVNHWHRIRDVVLESKTRVPFFGTWTWDLGTWTCHIRTWALDLTHPDLNLGIFS